MILGIRPTDFEDGAAPRDPALPRMRVKADVVEELGSESHVIFTLDAPRVTAEAVRAAPTRGRDEGMLFADDVRALFTARVDARLRCAGDEVTLAIDAPALHPSIAEVGPGARRGRRAPAGDGGGVVEHALPGPAARGGSPDRPAPGGRPRLSTVSSRLPGRLVLRAAPAAVRGALTASPRVEASGGAARQGFLDGANRPCGIATGKRE